MKRIIFTKLAEQELEDSIRYYEVESSGPGKRFRDEVLDRLEIFSKGEGFVFNTIHNILPDVPPENIVAMYDAIKEFNNR